MTYIIIQILSAAYDFTYPKIMRLENILGKNVIFETPLVSPKAGLSIVELNIF